MTAHPRVPWWTGVPITVGVAAAWIALAVNSPTTTYHFAPAVLAAVVPVSRRLRAEERLPTTDLLFAAGAGLAAALVVTAVLSGLGALTGPTFAGTPGATVETLVMAVAGAAVGVAYGLKPAGRRTGSGVTTDGKHPETRRHDKEH